MAMLGTRVDDLASHEHPKRGDLILADLTNIVKEFRTYRREGLRARKCGSKRGSLASAHY